MIMVLFAVRLLYHSSNEGSMKEEGIDRFVSIYGKNLGSFKELEIEGCVWCLYMTTRINK